MRTRIADLLASVAGARADTITRRARRGGGPCARVSLRAIGVLALLAGAPAAHAQWAVIDVGAIAQLVQQVELTEQALVTARSELQQVEQTYRAMTGDRGMESLLSGTVRNYMPTSSSELQGLLSQTSSAYPTLVSSMQSAVATNAVLTPQQLQGLSADAVAYLQGVRRTTALLQAIEGAALANSSGRFSALQQLINAITTDTDQKGSLDLNARISAEQSMLQDEQTKLQVLFQSLIAQQWSDQAREREQIVADHGDFSSRFAPAP